MGCRACLGRTLALLFSFTDSISDTEGAGGAGGAGGKRTRNREDRGKKGGRSSASSQKSAFFLDCELLQTATTNACSSIPHRTTARSAGRRGTNSRHPRGEKGTERRAPRNETSPPPPRRYRTNKQRRRLGKEKQQKVKMKER